jgi:hypothetical protein
MTAENLWRMLEPIAREGAKVGAVHPNRPWALTRPVAETTAARLPHVR